MRTPIYPYDLISKTGGFRKIASVLQFNWPGSSPISIFQARHIVAQGLGYKNLQALKSYSLNSVDYQCEYSSNKFFPIFYKIIVAALKKQSSMNPEPSVILNLVELLPLHELHIFRGENSPVTFSKYNSHSLTVRRNGLAIRTLTVEELLKISVAASSFSTKRDVVMHELLRLGYRTYEVAGARITRNGLIQIPVDKSRNAHMPLPKSEAIKLMKIVKVAGIPPDSFLFPTSSGDKHIPLVKVARTFHSWVVKSGLDQLGITLHVFRRSVAAHRFDEIGRIHLPDDIDLNAAG